MIFSTNVYASSKISKGKVKALYDTFLSKKEVKIGNSYRNTIILENAYFMTYTPWVNVAMGITAAATVAVLFMGEKPKKAESPAEETE